MGHLLEWNKPMLCSYKSKILSAVFRRGENYNPVCCMGMMAEFRKVGGIGVRKWSSSICIGKERKKIFRGVNDVFLQWNKLYADKSKLLTVQGPSVAFCSSERISEFCWLFTCFMYVSMHVLVGLFMGLFNLLPMCSQTSHTLLFMYVLW